VKQILISLVSEGSSMRECIIGILNYAAAKRTWKLKLSPDPFGNTEGGVTPETLDKLLRDGLGGVITGISVHTPGFRKLVTCGVPVVLNNAPPDWTPASDDPIAFVYNDDLAIGRLAATYFHNKGCFRSYAFFPDERKCSWSTYRRRGFGLALAQWNIRPVCYDRRRQALETWLAGLPKPAAIFAVNDAEAINVVEACSRLGLVMPEQVSILGVDNEEILCKAVRPQLSSIRPNHVEMGRKAALALDRLMRGKSPSPVTYVAPLGIVERESTRTIPPAGHLIDRAHAYIADNLGEGISARDVAEHLGVSAALLRLRFQKTLGKSVRDVILDLRLENARRLLSSSNLTVSQVAEKTGFDSVCRFSHFFAERTGKSPRAWRCAKR